jgi:hypothetical protein
MTYLSYKFDEGAGSNILFNLHNTGLRPDGSAIVTFTLVDSDWTTQVQEQSYKCSFGRGLRFKIIPKSDEAIFAYSSYDETKAAIMDGLQMQIIFSPTFCDLVEGPPITPHALVSGLRLESR